jgi:hypothetical protein
VVDAGKKIKGRKRHIATDVLGLLLAETVTAGGCLSSGIQPGIRLCWERKSSMSARGCRRRIPRGCPSAFRDFVEVVVVVGESGAGGLRLYLEEVAGGGEPAGPGVFWAFGGDLAAGTAVVPVDFRRRPSGRGSLWWCGR